MRFQKGNKFSKGGTKGNKGGRPSMTELRETQRAIEKARTKLVRKYEAITECYTELATDRQHASTTQHAMENYVLPVEKDSERSQPPVIQFITFTEASLQRPTKEVVITTLEKRPDRANRLPPPRSPLPAPVAEEKADIKHPQVTFHDFAGKRR
jgi:hypothetical protein